MPLRRDSELNDGKYWELKYKQEHIIAVFAVVLGVIFWLEAPEPDKIPLKRKRSDPRSIEQPGFFHAPVDLFVVDDPAVPELRCHVLIPVAAEFLAQDLFYL